MSFQFTTAKELLDLCLANDLPISEVMLRRELELFGTDRQTILTRLHRALEIMKNSATQPLRRKLPSMGGLIGGEGQRLFHYLDSGSPLIGKTVFTAVSYAMSVLETNASMGLIVAAPTAGSSGVLPGVLLALQEKEDYSDDSLCLALLNASAIGYLITRNGTVAGADGGCQAEVGAASAMAASAAVELHGGTVSQCFSAASTALSNLLGLVCDPIAGLVEAPCQKRNAIGAANAMLSADLAQAQVSALIPLDEMIQAMLSVGRSLPYELRETALGGVAATPTGCRLCEHCLL